MRLAATVFYSWQRDLPSKANRNLIQDALEAAAKELRRVSSIYAAPEITRDTEGVPGSPEIHQAIFKKISNASAAVFDVSLVTPRAEGKKQHPNANVLVELGFALAKLGESRIVL